MNQLQLSIDGMSCGHCVKAVRGALEGVDGVSVGDVIVGEARVSFDPAKTSREAIVGAIDDAGYSARAHTGASA